MPYSTKEEIESDFKNMDFTSTSNVTETDVDGFILEADALINSYVGMKYVIPVTADATSLSLLKLFSRTLVADRIKKILEVKQETSKGANQDVRGAYSTKDVMAALEKIKKDQLMLPGAETLVGDGGTFYSSNYANSVCPVVEKDSKQW